ncbi:uncharacterized protein LOC111393075 [Olea europaea var. sylvestris]|uniref:uncharacterized protein LOC111393075 n=1 Tax=Olea europaea var. sylvestris TaxID=158386 RepID=UPI000C1D1676|nr:uncharacterized protein LOC111393075 [Olea europaea var. sylvestris]
MGQIRRVNEICYEYLEQADFSFWSRALFVGDWYNIMTNNNAESLNSMLRHACSLPITCLVEHIRKTMQKWFYERRTNATSCNNLTQVGISNDTEIVDFSDNTCTCREFQLNLMPCAHATRAATLIRKSLYDLCSPYYKSEYWRGAYMEVISPVTREVDWVVPNEILGTPILPPIVRRPPGKPPTRRKRARYEFTTQLRKCTGCGRVGHNRTTCSNPTVSQAT